MRMANYGQVHVLTADRMTDRGAHCVPLALRLAREIEAEKGAHPIAASGLSNHSTDLSHALRAVSHGFGIVGKDLAFKRVPPGGGSVPMTMWLDSGKTAEERGTRVIPS
jgi:hypothetical protein